MGTFYIYIEPLVINIYTKYAYAKYVYKAICIIYLFFSVNKYCKDINFKLIEYQFLLKENQSHIYTYIVYMYLNNNHLILDLNSL